VNSERRGWHGLGHPSQMFPTGCSTTEDYYHEEHPRGSHPSNFLKRSLSFCHHSKNKNKKRPQKTPVSRQIQQVFKYKFSLVKYLVTHKTVTNKTNVTGSVDE
jgi:hypothetical protein